ncbi:MAG: NADH:flavin oxidoreductase [Pseudomonadota bacterium]
MSILFEPIKIGSLEVPNRFVRSATNDGGADEKGFVTDRQVELYTRLGQSGLGLIISGALNVQVRGQIMPFQKVIVGDEYIPGLTKLTAAAHKHGACLAAQLYHGGAEAGRLATARGLTAVAPSYLGDDPHFPLFKADYARLSEEEIRDLIRDFGQAARRAREAGFDAVQVHAAHGYIFSQFLSPYTNRREDQWGGTLDNRLRFHREVFKEMRRQAGEDYPLMIKLGVEDSFSGGLEFEEGRQAAKILAELGFDALEISSGARGSGWEQTEFRMGINKVTQEAYYRRWSREIKPEVLKPVVLVGGLRSFDLMEEIVSAGEADFVSLSRPLIREPHLINDWKQGDRRRAACISCNKCIELLLAGQMIECVQLKKKASDNQGR